MALSARKKKGILLFNLGGAAIGGTCCGLSFVPWGGAGTSGPRTLRYGSWYPRFVLGSTDGEESDGSRIKMPRELFVEASNSLIQKGENQEISFDDVTMKLGTKVLKAGDTFFKVEGGEESGYYFAQHMWNTEFRLDNGERKSWNDLANGKGKPSENGNSLGKAKTIKLTLKNGTQAGGGANGKSIFMVGSCKFTLHKPEKKSKEWKNIETKCKTMGGEDGNGGDIILTGKHEHHYIYTVTK